MATNFDSAVVSAGDVALASQYNNIRKDIIKNAGDYEASTGSANAYLLSIDAQYVAYAAGDVIKFKATLANTSAATLNINALGAKSIKKNNVSNLISGDIEAGQIVSVIYDGTNFQLYSPINVINRSFGGDGSDGVLAIISGATNIDLAGAKVKILNYESISITGTGSLTFTNPHDQGTLIVLKSLNDVIITSSATPAINLVGIGAKAGLGGASHGAVGTNGLSILDSGLHYGVGGVTGGASGAGGLSLSLLEFYSNEDYKLTRKVINLAVGSGAGSGAQGYHGSGYTIGDGTDGGRGGGSLIIQCSGSLNFTGDIDISGQNGYDSANVTGSLGAGCGGCGGGGSAGMSIVLYNSLTANTGSIIAAGGDGGTSGDATATGGGSGTGSGGAAGGGGGSKTGAGGTGGAAGALGAGGSGAVGANRSGSTPGTTTGAAGGAGGASDSSAYYIGKNLYF